MIATVEKPPEDGEDRRHPGCGGNAGLGAFQRTHALHQFIGVGVFPARINISRLFPDENGAGRLGIGKTESGCHVDGRHVFAVQSDGAPLLNYYRCYVA